MQVATFIKLIKHLQSQHTTQAASATRKAGTAAVFRFVPLTEGKFGNLPCLSNDALLDWKDLQSSVNSQKWASEADVQLLFIKRSMRTADRHSGQVAFPGGKADPNETAYETAVRETE